MYKNIFYKLLKCVIIGIDNNTFFGGEVMMKIDKKHMYAWGGQCCQLKKKITKNIM